MDINESIAEIIDQLRSFDTAKWSSLPDIELYMDQVIVYLNKLLKPLLRSDDAAMLTPSMINNYVKSGHIKRPEKKKYKKEQVAALYMLCSVKQNLMITDAAALFEMLDVNTKSDELYDIFINMQQSAFLDTSEKIDNFLATNENITDDTIGKLALLLTLQAACSRLAAERIISYLADKKDNAGKQKTKND